GRDDDALESFDAADARLTRLARRSAVVTAVGSGLSTFAVGATVWGMLLMSVAAQHGGHLSRVALAAVVLTGLAAFEVTAPLSAAAQQLAAARASAARIFEVIDLPDPVTEPAE